VIAFRVDGIPAPKGSFRIARKRNGKGFTVRKDSDKTEAWHEAVGWAAKAAMGGTAPLVGRPLRVVLTFFLPRPKSVKAVWPQTKPDLDKLVRATLDPLEGIAFDGDSRVVQLRASKLYADQLAPGCRIEIEGM
jgi:Holliday junction resolvase RusA-like endonuclease